MKDFNLRDFLFKDPAGEETGKRAMLVVTHALGFVLTGIWALSYQSPPIIALSGAASLAALITLIQVLRGKIALPMVLPVMIIANITAISLLEGEGAHDLIWAGSLGVFLLVNIYSGRNNSPVPFIFILVAIAPFITIGVLEINGVIPNPFGTDLHYLLLRASLILGIMGAITAVFHRHRVLLRESSESWQRQEHSRESLERLNKTLEDQIRLRTEELTKLNEQLLSRAAKLQAAIEISQEIMNNPLESISDLLARTTRLISEKLGYYHVGVFLLDEYREFAALRASNSKGGQEMLARRHQLKVGGAGIVGYVSQSGRPRIALDTGMDAVFFNNPYLPQTRSEIALPVKFANTVIGVLDVQSTQPSAFTDEDASALMTIANQIAVMIHKNEEEEDAADPKRRRRSTQFISPTKKIGYSFRPDGSLAGNAILPSNPLLEKALIAGETVATNRLLKDGAPVLIVPVRLRDNVIGVIHIESDGANRNWTEDEIMLTQAVADRAALALENAELFENATRQAEQEQTISRITTQIGASTDFERIMQTTIQELGLALGASRAYIQVSAPPAASAKDAE